MSLGLQGWAPLRHAAFRGDVAMVQLFLSHGASADAEEDTVSVIGSLCISMIALV